MYYNTISRVLVLPSFSDNKPSFGLENPAVGNVGSTGRAANELEHILFVDPSRSASLSMSTSWPWWMTSQPTASAHLLQPQSAATAADYWFRPMSSSCPADDSCPSLYHRSNTSGLLTRHDSETLLPLACANCHRGSSASNIKCESTGKPMSGPLQACAFLFRTSRS